MHLYADYNKRKESSEHAMSNLGEWIEEKAIEKTIEKTTKELILNMHKYGLSSDKIADIVKKDISEVQEIISNS